MKVLFVHNNFPAQFRNLVEALQEMGGFELAAIGAESAQAVEGVALHRYALQPLDVSATHPFARRFDAECRRAEQVLMTASVLACSGFVPDIILAHCGWGETLPLRPSFQKRRSLYTPNSSTAAKAKTYILTPKGRGLAWMASPPCNVRTPARCLR